MLRSFGSTRFPAGGQSPVTILSVAVLAVLILPSVRISSASDSSLRRADQTDPVPKGAVALLGTTRFRSSSESGVFFLADSRTVVTEHGLFNVETGRRLRGFDFGLDRARVMNISSDRRSLATLGILHDEKANLLVNDLRFWDENLELRSGIRWPIQSTPRAIVLPDQRVAVVGGEDGILTTWDVESKTKLREQLMHGPAGQPLRIESLNLSPDGKWLAVSGMNGILICDAQNPEKLNRLLPSTGRRPKASAFSPDGSILAVSEDGATSARLFDVQSGEMKAVLKGGRGIFHYASRITFTHDGKRLIIPGREAVEVWDVEERRLERSLSIGTSDARVVDLSPDGEWLVAGGSWEPVLHAWNTRTWEPVATPAGHEGNISSMQFTPGGDCIVSASEDGTVQVWDSSTGRRQQVLHHEHIPQRSNWVRACAVSPDGRLIASSSLDDTVRLWDSSTGRQVYSLFGHGQMGGQRAVGFSPDGARLYSWGDDRCLRVYSTATGKAIAEHRVNPDGKTHVGEAPDGPEAEPGFEAPVQAFFSADCRRLYMSNGMTVDTANGHSTFDRAPHSIWERDIFSGDMSREARLVRGPPVETRMADGRVRGSVSSERTLVVSEPSTNKQLFSLKMPDGFGAAPSFSREGRLIAVAEAGDQRPIHVYDGETGQELYRVTNTGPAAKLIVLSPDGRQLAVAHSDTTITTWKLDDWRVASTAAK
jgi:WD40 repeat protein